MNSEVKKKHLNNAIEYTLNNRNIISQFMASTKKGETFTDDELIKFVTITTKFIEAKNKIPSSWTKLNGDLHTLPLPTSTTPTFYKYMTEQTYNTYIAKGKFKLGSLSLYRSIEKIESRDDREGNSNILIDTNDGSIFISVISGFNYYVLCGTGTQDNSEYMSKKFGNIRITINDVKSFADSVSKMIGATRWFIKHVGYSDFKFYRTMHEFKQSPTSGIHISAELFDFLIDKSTLPSLFVKPAMFTPECELRLVFEIPKKAQKELKVHNQGLLRHVTATNIQK